MTFLTREDFERSARHAGIFDLSADQVTGNYRNPSTAAAYRVWESVAHSEHARKRPVAWLIRRNGRDQDISLVRPYQNKSPEQWQSMISQGWELPLGLYPALPCNSVSEDAVLREHQRQRLVKGYSVEGDGRYLDGELVRAALCYALQALGVPSSVTPTQWPWPGYPMKQDTPLRALEKAAALLISEHERRSSMEQIAD